MRHCKLVVLMSACIVTSAFAPAESYLDYDPGADTRTRALTVRALGETGDAQSLETLFRAFSDVNVFVRAEAVQAVRALALQTGADEVVPPLLETLESGEAKVRHAAVETLGLIGAASAGDALIGALGDENAEVQFAAACALGRLGIQKAVGALQETALQGEPFARMGACWALGELRASEAVETLVLVIRSGGRGEWNYTSPPVYAAEALAKINDPSCAPALRDALSIPDRHLRAELERTLNRLNETASGASTVATDAHEE